MLSKNQFKEYTLFHNVHPNKQFLLLFLYIIPATIQSIFNAFFDKLLIYYLAVMLY